MCQPGVCSGGRPQATHRKRNRLHVELIMLRVEFGSPAPVDGKVSIGSAYRMERQRDFTLVASHWCETSVTLYVVEPDLNWRMFP